MSHPADNTLSLTLAQEVDTLELGARLGQALRGGMAVHLSGDLGAGKTTLVRGVLRGLGFTGRVKSPTYTLMEPYVVSAINLYHFDLYRFADPVEWEEAGFREYFNAGSVCLVEWPEKAAGLLPAPDLTIDLEWLGEPGTDEVATDGRVARLTAYTEAGRRCMERLAKS